MSIINSFLQKRKMHENQHGFVMVITAYVLSIIMLVLGSDIFYNINSEAAGVTNDTDEEAEQMRNSELSEIPSVVLANTILHRNPVNLFGMNEFKTALQGPVKQESGIAAIAIQPDKETVDKKDAINLLEDITDTTNSETIWLLGSALSNDEYEKLMEQMNSIDVLNSPEKENGTEGKEVNSTKSPSTKETNSSYVVEVTDKEIEMLERIVEAEAGGEDMKGKILIANVIFNRMEDKHFPDTVKGVIFQEDGGEYQFSPVSDKRYWNVKVSKSTKKAVRRALEGEDYSKGALYFIARKRTKSSSAKWFDNNLDWLFKHGGHEFYKNK